MKRIQSKIAACCLLMLASCTTVNPGGFNGVWLFPASPDPDLDKKGENVLILGEKSFSLDDDWTPGKTNAAPISGTWVCTNGVIVLHVTHTECCKAPEGTELRLRVLEHTTDSLRVTEEDSREETMLKRLPQQPPAFYVAPRRK
jgi:hypothetical protein